MSAQAAINQIDLKDYSSKFSLSGLPIVKVGINFDPERRTNLWDKERTQPALWEGVWQAYRQGRNSAQMELSCQMQLMTYELYQVIF